MRPIDLSPSSPDPATASAIDLPASERTVTALAAVADAVTRLRFGAVHLTIHDGRVVQLDVTERQRFG